MRQVITKISLRFEALAADTNDLALAYRARCARPQTSVRTIRFPLRTARRIDAEMGPVPDYEEVEVQIARIGATISVMPAVDSMSWRLLIDFLDRCGKEVIDLAHPHEGRRVIYLPWDQRISIWVSWLQYPDEIGWQSKGTATGPIGEEHCPTLIADRFTIWEALVEIDRLRYRTLGAER